MNERIRAAGDNLKRVFVLLLMSLIVMTLCIEVSISTVSADIDITGFKCCSSNESEMNIGSGATQWTKTGNNYRWNKVFTDKRGTTVTLWCIPNGIPVLGLRWNNKWVGLCPYCGSLNHGHIKGTPERFTGTFWSSRDVTCNVRCSDDKDPKEDKMTYEYARATGKVTWIHKEDSVEQKNGKVDPPTGNTPSDLPSYGTKTSPEDPECSSCEEDDLICPITLVTSTDSNGNAKESFNLHEIVYAKGTGFCCKNLEYNTTHTIYVCYDPLNDGDSLSACIYSTVIPDSNCDFIPQPASLGTFALGDYDIVVDINENGIYDLGIDAIDSSVTVGFSVIPEFPTIVIPAVTILGLLFLISRRKQER